MRLSVSPDVVAMDRPTEGDRTWSDRGGRCDTSCMMAQLWGSLIGTEIIPNDRRVVSSRKSAPEINSAQITRRHDRVSTLHCRTKPSWEIAVSLKLRVRIVSSAMVLALNKQGY